MPDFVFFFSRCFSFIPIMTKSTHHRRVRKPRPYRQRIRNFCRMEEYNGKLGNFRGRILHVRALQSGDNA